VSQVDSILLTSVIIAVPVGIAANLLSTPIQKQLDKALNRSGEKRQATRADYERRVLELAQDKEEFHVFLSGRILQISFFTAVFALIAGRLMPPVKDLILQTSLELVRFLSSSASAQRWSALFLYSPMRGTRYKPI
jgi:Na+/H+-dicarboxylate symporter